MLGIEAILNLFRSCRQITAHSRQVIGSVFNFYSLRQSLSVFHRKIGTKDDKSRDIRRPIGVVNV
jgi:hypothetical protein